MVVAGAGAEAVGVVGERGVGVELLAFAFVAAVLPVVIEVVMDLLQVPHLAKGQAREECSPASTS